MPTAAFLMVLLAQSGVPDAGNQDVVVPDAGRRQPGMFEREELVRPSAQQPREERGIEERKKRPDAGVVALSARLCRYQSLRKASLAEVATEKRYAQIGGVQNLTKLYSLQRQVRLADEQIAAVRKAFAEVGKKPRPCADRTIAAVVACAKANFMGCPEELSDYVEILMAVP